MPNPHDIRRSLEEAKEAARARMTQEAAQESRMREIGRLGSIVALFDTPGWGHLMEEFQHQRDGVLAVMTEEAPLGDQQLQLLRAELVYVTRLLALDKSIKERLDLLKKK